MEPFNSWNRKQFLRVADEEMFNCNFLAKVEIGFKMIRSYYVEKQQHAVRSMETKLEGKETS